DRAAQQGQQRGDEREAEMGFLLDRQRANVVCAFPIEREIHGTPCFANYPWEARILGLSAPWRREVRQVFRRDGAATIAPGKPDRTRHRIALRHHPVDAGRIVLDAEKP
ncbi:hypothetical protein, partial [Burkholderia cenocepacia]